MHNVRVPGMLHGRIVRPRGQGAYGAGSTPLSLSVDASSIAHIPGAQIVQVDNFLGVVAPQEYDAIQAAAQLKVTWQTIPTIPGVGDLWEQMRNDSSGQICRQVLGNTGNVDPAIAGAAKTVTADLQVPLPGPRPDRPHLAVADVTPC